MAYLRLGYDRAALREIYEREAPSLGDRELVAKFGPPPYRFLVEDDAVALTYNELRSALYRDQEGRQYQPVGPSAPRSAHVRLSKAVLVRQRRELAETGHTQGDRVLDFPRADDVLRLTVIGSRKKTESAFDPAAMAALDDPPELVGRDSFLATVARVTVPPGRIATAVVEFASDLPQVSAVPDSTVARRDPERELARERRKLGIGEEEAELDEEQAEKAARYAERGPRIRFARPRLSLPLGRNGKRKRR